MPQVSKNKKRLIKIPRIPRPSSKGIHCTLSSTFYVLWIIIGIIVLILLVQSFRQGVFSQLFSSQESQQAPTAQQQTEADLPGVGVVNIACVKSALSTDAIQKVINDKGTQSLTDDEKAKFEPCIVQKVEATPSAS